ncbi:MAG: type 11 methyltransferase [Bacteroidetes bacterium OLB12]|nr:MAG: type 11 methyltransferase [Bacteroidetes bacterium OLB12]
MQYYEEKSTEYFTRCRTDLIQFLPPDKGLNVLEIGAGGGDTLMTLKQSGKAKSVTGVELFQIDNSFQTSPHIDQFIFGNIENIQLDFPANHFDAVLFGDVLEHLLDPWSVIAKLSPFVKPGGRLIASIPNIRSRQALKSIYFKGDFAYTSQGLFDKTHYRWFCKKI